MNESKQPKYETLGVDGVYGIVARRSGVQVYVNWVIRPAYSQETASRIAELLNNEDGPKDKKPIGNMSNVANPAKVDAFATEGEPYVTE